MNKLKIIVLIICAMFILQGCTVRSEITLNPNGTVDESVSVLANTRIFESDAYSKEQLIDSAIEEHKAVLDFKKYSYDYVLGDDLSGARIYKTYDNICDYFGNSAFNQYVYKYMDCTENDDYYEITNATDYIPYCSNCSDWPALDDVTLSISLPVSATEQNADEINGTTYIWKYDENTNDDKSFYLRISKSALEESEQRYNEEQENKKNRNTIITICVIAGIVIALGLIIIVLYTKHKKNKIDY